MGLRVFSMSPAFVPRIKQLASVISVAAAEETLQRALELKTTAEVKRFMTRNLQKIAPDFGLLDSV